MRAQDIFIQDMYVRLYSVCTGQSQTELEVEVASSIFIGCVLTSEMNKKEMMTVCVCVYVCIILIGNVEI